MNIIYQDIKLHYEKYGEKKENLIILPGWGETKASFSSMIEILKDYYTVYFIDYPGFGKSTFPNRDLTMFDYAECILYFLDILNIKHPYVLAHSFGGRVAILLSGKYAYHIKRLVLMDSAGIKPRKTIKSYWRGKLYKLLQKLANLLPKKKKKKVKNYLFQKFSSTDYYNLDENMRTTFKNIVNLDLTFYLPYISTETLLIWGEKDLDTPLKDGIKMQKKIRDSELIVFPNSTHFSYLENTYVILKIILEFFS